MKKLKILLRRRKNYLLNLRNNEVALNNLQIAIERLVAAEIKKANEEKARKAAVLLKLNEKPVLKPIVKPRRKPKPIKKPGPNAESGVKIPEPVKPNQLQRLKYTFNSCKSGSCKIEQHVGYS